MPKHPDTFKTNLNLAREAKAAKDKEERAKAMKAASMATHPKGPLPPRIGGPPAVTKRHNSRKTRKQRTRRNRL